MDKNYAIRLLGYINLDAGTHKICSTGNSKLSIKNTKSTENDNTCSTVTLASNFDVEFTVGGTVALDQLMPIDIKVEGQENINIWSKKAMLTHGVNTEYYILDGAFK